MTGIFLAAAARVADRIPGTRIAIGAAEGVVDIVERRVRAAGIEAKVVRGKVYELLRAADLAICASGTVTLEAAIVGTPMIVGYRLATLTYMAARMLVTMPCVSLANIVAGAPVVPELLQSDCSADALGGMAASLLERPSALAAMRRKLVAVRARLGGPGATERASDAILEVLHARG